MKHAKQNEHTTTKSLLISFFSLRTLRKTFAPLR